MLRFVAVLLVIFVSACSNDSANEKAPAAAAEPAADKVANPELEISSSAEYVTAGDEFTLTWKGVDVRLCQAKGSWNGDKATQGSESLAVFQASVKTYVIACVADDRNAAPISAKAIVKVDPKPQPQVQPQSASDAPGIEAFTTDSVIQ